MNIKELRAKSAEELRAKLLELRKDLVKENAQVAMGSHAKSSGRIRQIRKTIARIMMLLSEQQRKEEGLKA